MVFPRYVNSFLARVSMTALALRILRRAAPALTMTRLAIQLPPHARALGSDLADHGARRGAAALAGGSALEVVRAAAVRVVDGVHGHTADAGPAHALGAHGVVLLAGLEERLVAAAAAGHEADGGAGERVELAELAGGHADDGGLLGVRHDLGGGAGGLDELAAVVGPGLEVEHRGALGDLAHDGDVAGLDLRGVREDDLLAHRHALVGDLDEHGAVRHLQVGEGGGAAAGVLERLDDGRAGPLDGVLDVALVAVRRARHARGRGSAAPGEDAFAHQNTPMRMPMSSAEVSPPNLTMA